MTKEEILAKVQATIAGQGNEVDLGGALPVILNAIVELIPEGPGKILRINTPSEFEIKEVNRATLADRLGITESDVDLMFSQNCNAVIVKSRSDEMYLQKVYFLSNNDSSSISIVFGAYSTAVGTLDFGGVVMCEKGDGVYSFGYNII